MKKKLIVAVLILLIGIGFFVRFYDLGVSPFKADSMEFYKLALRNQNIVEFWKNPPWLNQIPLNETLSLLLVKAGLPATPFVVRIPFALMGVLALCFIGKFAGRFGIGAVLTVLVLGIFNPYQLYFSRMAYHYSGALAWSAVLFYLFWMLRKSFIAGELPPVKAWVLYFVTAVIACHMHMSVWPVIMLQAALIFISGVSRFFKTQDLFRRFLISFFTGYILLGAAITRWIYRALLEVTKGAAERGGHIGFDATTELVRLLPSYFAGENLPAIILLFIFIVLATAALFGRNEKAAEYRSLAWICVLHLAVVMLYVVIIGGGVAKISYFSAVWPHVILLLGIGAALGVQQIPGRVARAVILFILSAGYIGLTAVPDWAIIRLEGKPAPYYKLNQWILENLPAGTPVLTDRWYEPWNELMIHNSGGINYTFTVPDEPVELYRQFNWRQTAEQFFEKYPDAAFVEVDRDQYERELGEWTFPKEHFAQTASITNDYAMVLRRWKVFPELSFAAADTNRTVLIIHYNTPDDLIAAARSSGKSFLRLYGEDWGFAKPGWPQGQFEDFRLLFQSAELNIYNLTDAPVSGTLTVTAATSAQVKAVTAGEKSTVFSSGRLKEWAVPVTVNPGKNTIKFSSPTADPLFVLDTRFNKN